MQLRKIILASAVLFSVSVAADMLDDITSGKYKPKQLEAVTPMSDGENYAMLRDGAVYACSYKNGAVTDTLYASERVKGGGGVTAEGFILSPDRRFMLVFTGKKQIFRHSFSAEWYLYDTRRRELRPLSAQIPVRNPLFSPDGKYIAFVRDNNIFIHKVDYNTEVAVTTDGKPDTLYNGAADWLYEEEFGTTAVMEFSPDSKQLAFVRLDDSEVPFYSWQEFLDEEGRALRRPVMRSVRYPKAGDANPKASLCIYDTYYKSVRTIALPDQADSYLPRLRWTGTQADAPGELAALRLNRDQNRYEIFMVNPKSTLSRLFYKEESRDSWVDYSNFDKTLWLADGSCVAVSEKDGYRHAYLLGAQGNEKQQLTKGICELTDVYGFDEADRILYFQAATTPLTRDVYALNLKKGAVTRLTSAEGIHSAQFSNNFKYFIHSFQSYATPLKAEMCDRKGQTLFTLLDNSTVAEAAKAAGMPVKEYFSFVTERGDTLAGWILRPKQTGKPSPALLMQYSGPASQQATNRWRIDWEEYLAAERGVLCVCVDPRGTGGRGRAFRSLTYMNIGALEAQDHISLARYLVREKLADSARIAIWGWSYGGFQALRTLLDADASSTFCCGIAVAPVTDWRLYDSAYTERYMRRPQVNDGGYDRADLSVIAERLSVPVLIAHGMADDNVHVQHTFLLSEAFGKAGRQFDMQIYPDDNHFLRKRSDYSHLYHTMLRFLEQHMLSSKD